MIRLGENFGGGKPELQPKKSSEELKEVNASLVPAVATLYLSIEGINNAEGVKIASAWPISRIKEEITGVINILRKRQELIRKIGYLGFLMVVKKDEERILKLEQLSATLSEKKLADPNFINVIEEIFH